ncbi:hypothetical protein ACFZDK_42090 [Streptomyces sp. NPDC007901]|uniref:hypothetical protein n=1 Tax=Streptomyces sp. NPDC007901 TaxID=3364785 RepID=UPI0036E97146
MTSLAWVLAACGAGQDAQEGASAKPLSKAALEQAALTGTDLDGYEVQRDLAATSASRKTAEPAECAPAVQAVGGSSGFAATARTARIVFSKAHGPSAHLTLSSHGSGEAERVIDALRTAAERCKTFKDVLVDFDYDEVQVRPDPGYGDESVSLRLTQLAAGSADEEPVRVPYAVVAVRQGATVAMFTTFNLPSGPRGQEPAAVPEAVIRAQLKKLGKVPAAAE